ncbi:hypothetical protein K1T71_008930 [Dendrolimus kikuchii]|uniref:Uncharacterized protein n=1 Tax=Dendrolimus kikuchii TaxID=765133 RepID=A0ACC1CVM2_9NEOP|nr:hypothetical protein K1T71_008930 [Dendrolimus kikuchii]
MSSLLRSTKFIRYFTGAARTLILNSAKTAEVNSLAKSLGSVNNVILRDYATSKKNESLEPLLAKLDSEVRRFGRITKKDIDEVFDEIRSKNDITSSQSLLVIRCCGELVPEELPEQRTLLVQKIWSVLTERGIPMDISHYNALLRVYLENEHPFSPAQFLEELERKGLQPNRVTYQRLMWRYCQEGDVEGATKVLEKMRELNFPVSEPVLNALVMGHAFHGDTDGAKAVLETMAGAGLQPTNRTYTLLACGHAKQGDIDGIESVIKLSTAKDAYMTDKDILDIIEHLAIAGHSDKVEALFKHLQKGVGYNQDVCNLILRLLNKGHDETAKKIMKTMPRAQTVEDTHFRGAFYVKQLLRLNKSPEGIIKACKELQDENLVPNALYIATEGALQQGNTTLAQKLFKELQSTGMEIRQHFYWPLLAQKGKEGDEEGLIQILREMTSNNVTPSGEALRDYVIPYMIKKDTPQNIIIKLQIANITPIFAARNVMIELLEVGEIKKAANIALQFRPRGQFSLVTRPLIIALNKTKDIDSLVTIIHVITSRGTQIEDDSANDDTQRDDTLSNELGRLVNMSIKSLTNPQLCEEFLQKLHDKGISINTETAENIEQYLGENMTTKLSELLAQLTSGDLELAPVESVKRAPITRSSAQLETLIDQLKSKGETNVSRFQRHLISAYIKENNVAKLESYLDELKSTNFEITVSTNAQLFEFFCLNNRLDKAKECREQIMAKNPEFSLSKYKLVLMAYALTKADRFDEAIQFLKENRPSVDSDNATFLLNSKCWQLLNTLAESKNSDKVKTMTQTLIENNYVDASNVILGPLIKVHLLNDDIESALKEFEFCCKQYRSTPWKGEIMKALIMKEDATKLQWLADISTQIHGEANILHDLVLAFVECGRLRQARRILETPGLQTRHRRLDDACQRYVEEGKSEYLEGLLEATKELSNIDRSNIFYHLLVTYCKANETDKALGLWTVLQEEGEVPSDQFLIYLGQHLKANNRDIPFVIPNTTETKVKSDNKIGKIIKQKEPTRVTKVQVSDNIEQLIQSNQLERAMDIVLQSMKDKVIPKPSVIKYLLRKLADNSEVENIQTLGKHLNEDLKKKVTFDDKLTLAIFNKGAGPGHVDNLYEMVQTAKTDEELDVALKKFPRSNALASVIQNDQLIAKCYKVAEVAASRGNIIPVNLIWMEYILAGKNKEAQDVWSKYLNDTESIVFRRLLQESFTRKEPELVYKLINALKQNKKITNGPVANAYSRLINYYLTEGLVDDAIKVLKESFENGITKDDLNSTCIRRLKMALETSGKQIDVAI